jgi:hypothetical protein
MLVECPACGKGLSRAAHACPTCGHPMKWDQSKAGQWGLIAVAGGLTWLGYHYLGDTIGMPWWGWLIAFGILAGGLLPR